jgi:succinyl-diaminopimelate desuccinylase
MPGKDNRIHGPDEHVSIEDIVTSAKIFAQVIIDNCK